MATLSRRSFIQTSALVGSVITAEGLVPRKIYAAGKSPGIRYRDLGKTGYKVSEVGFGAMNMRDPELVSAALDSGINYIDTAHGYMNGINEEVIGTVMKTRRKEAFLTTKIGSRNPKDIPGMLETSLKRLQTDHVDLVLLHGADKREDPLRDDIMKTYDDMRRKGMTRFVGFSTHNPAEIVEAALEADFWEAALVTYNYLSAPEVTDVIKKARQKGVAIIAMKTQLKGKGNPDAETDSTTRNQMALKWTLENSYVDVTIPGMTSFEQLEEDLAVMKMKLTSADSRELRQFGESLKGSYCCGVLGCEGCKDKCPYGVNVGEINRCLGYAVGYGDLRLARENYENLPSSSRIDICSNCDECQVKCINGLNLTDNIKKAREFFA